jgi:predicted nucleic acid-binding protein
VHEAEKTSLALLLTCDKELAEIVKSLPKKSYKMKK